MVLVVLHNFVCGICVAVCWVNWSSKKKLAPFLLQNTPGENLQTIEALEILNYLTLAKILTF